MGRSPKLLLIIKLILLSNLDIIDHLIPVLARFFLILLLLFDIRSLLVGGFLEIEVLLLHGFGCQTVKDQQHLLAVACFQFQWRELTRDLQFLAFLDNIA